MWGADRPGGYGPDHAAPRAAKSFEKDSRIRLWRKAPSGRGHSGNPAVRRRFGTFELGHAGRMEGGVAIILLLVIGAVLVGGAMLMLGGGALGSSKGDGDGDDGHRPAHKRPTDPVQENREFAGVHHDDEGQR